MTCRRLLLPLAAACLCVALPVHAGLPQPMTATRFAFPGSVPSPASATSAGLALADRWVGEDVASNPAAAPQPGVTLSPLLLRVSRQDLSAANREFEQVDLNFDFAGGQLGTRMRGVNVTLYAYQPQLRLENQSYLLGRVNSTGPRAAVENDGSLRETRLGLALGGGGALRVGAAVEWTRREDRYQFRETSGSPDAGLRDLSFDGSALGGAAGFRWERAPGERGGWVLGGGAHFTGALDVTGVQSADLTSGDSSSDIAASRGSIWDAGASARWTLSPESGVYGTVGTRSGETWDEFGVQAAPGQSWAIGIDFRDRETSWGARVGAGQDVQPGTPEPRATALGAGVSFYSGETVLDLGILHRAVPRPGLPTLSDDRVTASVRVAF